ncbi:MAG TPA: PfkB family carbohydrate kinase [Verrucomicrobiae bacterium]|nr:PfkB family carbohydrate kinase [Verrucomicrobiae bacterium]
MSVLVVGSVALDSVRTQSAAHDNLLGGSASYASMAASFFGPVRMVGIVGDDFPRAYMDLFASRGVDTAGLQRAKGKTFAWSGEYEANMNNRRTLSVALNVFETFRPDLPAAWRETEYVLLANIAPALQHHVLDQMRRPKFVVADTMDLWIETTRDDLVRLLGRVDMLILNDGEAKQLTGIDSLPRAAAALRSMGPRWLAIKKGEHGCLLFGEGEFFTVGAYPLEEVKDPTGCGDCFAGGLIGHLAASGTVDAATLRRAVVHGSVIASFNAESFSLKRLEGLSKDDVAARFDAFRRFSRFE